MPSSAQIDQIGLALMKVQAEARDVFKGSSGYGYSYADLSAVLEVVRPLLSKHGLAFVQMPGEMGLSIVTVTERKPAGKGEPDVLQDVRKTGGTVSLTTMLIHGASGQWMSEMMTMPYEEKKGLSSAQSVGMVITYMRRYAISAFVGIASTSDEDAAEPSLISAAEAKGLREALQKAGVDEERACAHYGATRLEELTQEQYAAVLRILAKKQRIGSKSALSPEEAAKAKVDALKARGSANKG